MGAVLRDAQFDIPEGCVPHFVCLKNVVLFRTTASKAMERPTYRPANANEVAQAARRVLAGQMRNFETLTSPQLVCDFLRVKPGTLEHEVLAVIHLDAQNRVIDHVKMSHTLPARPMLHVSSVQPIGAGTAHWYRLHRSEWCMTASGLSRRHHHHECIRNQLRQHLGFHRPTTAKVYHKRCDSNISRIGPVLG